MKFAKAADMLKEAGAKRVIGKSSATIHFWYEGFFLHWFSTKKVFVVIVSKSLQGIVTHGVLSGSALQVGYPPTPYVGRAGILQV